MNTSYEYVQNTVQYIISSSRNAYMMRDCVEDVGVRGPANESHPQHHCEREEETGQEGKVRVGDEERQVYELHTIFTNKIYKTR